MKFKHIKIVPSKEFENVFEVSNIHKSIKIGDVCFHFKCNKYCFYPCDDTFFDVSCLEDIIKFMESIEV